MSYYPVLIDWQGLPCLVAGGGKIALHKAELLCSAGADVTVVAIEPCEEICGLPVRLERRAVVPADVEGMRLVVDATGSAEAQLMLSAACRDSGIPFNSACRVDDGTAMFPAVSRKGRTVVAVSTLGASPAASTLIRDELAEQIPDEMDEILDAMAALRPLSRQWSDVQSDRRIFLRRCLLEMLKNKRTLTPEETEVIRHETLIK